MVTELSADTGQGFVAFDLRPLSLLVQRKWTERKDVEIATHGVGASGQVTCDFDCSITTKFESIEIAKPRLYYQPHTSCDFEFPHTKDAAYPHEAHEFR